MLLAWTVIVLLILLTGLYVAAEFIRRFLLHVLPSGLHGIRHYGFFGTRNRREKRVQSGFPSAHLPRWPRRDSRVFLRESQAEARLRGPLFALCWSDVDLTCLC
jgi:hypothetical protein